MKRILPLAFRVLTKSALLLVMRFSSILLLLGLAGCAIAAQAADTFEELSARATAARQANDAQGAIALYRQAVAANPQWQEGWWFLGTFLYETEQFPAARDAFRRFADMTPQAAPAWGLLSLCEFQTGEYGPALEHVQRGLSLGAGKEPQIGDVLRYHEALLLTRAGEFDKAIQKFTSFVRAGVANEPLLMGLGLAALRLPLTPKEVPADQRGLILAAAKATSFTLNGDAANTEQSFRELLSQYPQAPNVHYLYACYLMRNDPARAADELRQELKRTPGNPAAASMLAWALLTREDAVGALPYAERGAQGEPNSANAQYVLGRALVENGKVERGIDALERAVKLDPANLENHVALATAYPKAGRYQDAKRERQQSLALSAEMDARGARPQ